MGKEKWIVLPDFMSQEQRSRAMSKVRGSNTKPEKAIRSYLHAKGFRFRLHCANLPGKPDIVLKKYNAVIFVHGCFWHNHRGCKKATFPETRKEFWKQKIGNTVLRDRTNIQHLTDSNWRIAIIWECTTKNKLVLKNALENLTSWLLGDSKFFECSNPNYQIEL